MLSANIKIFEKINFANRLYSLDNVSQRKYHKNKTFAKIDNNANSFINIKNFDILKLKKMPYFRRKKNYFNYGDKKLKEIPLSFEIRNNDEKKILIKEINRSSSELKLQNKEMKKYQELYSNIKEQNNTNQIILYQIMNEEKEKEEQKENLDNIKPKKLKENNKSKSDNELPFTSLNSEKKKDEILSDIRKVKEEEPLSNKDAETDKQEFFLTKTLFSEKSSKKNIFAQTARNHINSLNVMKKNLFSLRIERNKKLLNRIKSKNHSSQINFLKKELDFYNKAIDKDEQKLEIFKKKEKISKFIEAQNELELQNKEIIELIKIYKEYKNKIKEFNIVIHFYKVKNENLVASINEIKNKIEKTYNLEKEDMEQDIPKLESDKKILEKQSLLYKTENEKIKKELDEYKKKEILLNEYIQNNEKFLKEKEQNNLDIINMYKLEQKLKQKMELKNAKIEKLKKDNSEINVYITKIAKDRRNKIMKKTKDEQIEKEKIEKIKNEINDINQKIQKYNYEKDVNECELEIEVNNQKDLIKEQENKIEDLKKNDEYIQNDIETLNNELEIINNDIKNKNYELELLVKSLEDLTNQKKLEDEIINMNEMNIKLKEENEKLLNFYKKKKNLNINN